DQFAGPLRRHDPGYPGSGQHVTFRAAALANSRERFGGHPDPAGRGSAARGLRLCTDVYHPGLTSRIEMGQIVHPAVFRPEEVYGVWTTLTVSRDQNPLHRPCV